MIVTALAIQRGPDLAMKAAIASVQAGAAEFLRYWHTTYLPKHFTEVAYSRYGYEERADKTYERYRRRARVGAFNYETGADEFGMMQRVYVGAGRSTPLVHTGLARSRMMMQTPTIGGGKSEAQVKAEIQSSIPDSKAKVITAKYTHLPRYLYYSKTHYEAGYKTVTIKHRNGTVETKHVRQNNGPDKIKELQTMASDEMQKASEMIAASMETHAREARENRVVQ